MPSTITSSAVSDMPMFAPADCLDRVAVITQSRVWTWREVHAASLDLADRLDNYHIVCNLCTSHLAFLITWLAAMRIGISQILPPSRGYSDLDTSFSVSTKATVVVSDEARTYINELPHIEAILFKPEISQSAYSNAQLSWMLDLELPLITFFTSGSTGRPTLNTKSLSQLFACVQVLRNRLNQGQCRQDDSQGDRCVGLFDRLDCLVSSVPLQHMFGIETYLMPSLVYGKSVIDQRPLLPADIQSVFERCPKNTAWITTPLHLKAISRAKSHIKNCSLVLVSTMPLSQELAIQTEVLVVAPVIEIYGSTETGALATRLTAIEKDWQLLNNVEIAIDQQAVIATGKHFNSPQFLNDSIELISSRRFKLIGRRSDLIKVAGRRTSLLSLNLSLQNLKGLDDGAFYLPTSASPDERVILVYVSSVLSREEIKTYLKGKIDSIFIPRVFIQVSQIPRTSGGKLTYLALANIHEAWLAQRKQS